MNDKCLVIADSLILIYYGITGNFKIFFSEWLLFYISFKDDVFWATYQIYYIHVINNTFLDVSWSCSNKSCQYCCFVGIYIFIVKMFYAHPVIPYTFKLGVLLINSSILTVSFGYRKNVSGLDPFVSLIVLEKMDLHPDTQHLSIMF